MKKSRVRMISACLRTNKYKQIRGQLHTEGNNVCFAGLVLLETGTNASALYHYLWGDKWQAKIRRIMGRLTIPVQCRKTKAKSAGLMWLNDTGITFPQLADLIDYFILGEPCVSGGQIKSQKNQEVLNVAW